jgi:D-aspartate ligase
MHPLVSSIMTPAIVLSSHIIGLAVIRGLGMMGVPVIVFYYQKQDMGFVSKYVKKAIYAPHPERSENEFISLLIDYGQQFSGSLLIPADDATQVVVSRHKTILERYYTVACPEWKITRRFIDKKHTYALAKAIGVSIPKTIVPGSIDAVKHYGKIIEYPCIIKPCQSHRYFEIFRKKMVRVENFDQMLSAYIQATQAGVEVMLQEYIPGDDTHGVNYNSYFWNGRPLIEVTAEKVRLAPPGFGVPRVLISKDIPEIIQPGRKILQAMNFYGYSCTEFKKDERDGDYKLMEVNGRHNRSGLLSVHCGTNFPWITYSHLVQGQIPPTSPYRNGIYWIDFTADILHSIMYGHKELYPLYEYLKPYLREHVFALFDWRDPKPFFKRYMDLIKMGFLSICSSFK